MRTLVDALCEWVAADEAERTWRALEAEPVDPLELALAAVGPPVVVPIIPGRPRA
jgi:hypothetical protein